MDIDKLVKEALERINKHIDQLVKKHLREMRKQFGVKQ